MSNRPPARLIDLLTRLGLASEGQIVSLGGRAARLARGLPTFDSIWVDALAQARLLTPFQAAEINAGRGEALHVGAYVLVQPLDWPCFAAGYLAREVSTGHPVRLTLIEPSSPRNGDLLAPLEALASRSQALEAPGIAPILLAGAHGRQRFVVSRWDEGQTPAQWLVSQGRMKPDVVLELARQMLDALVFLEHQRLCHGDVSAGSLVVTREGQAVLVQPGLRALVRPEEGFAQAELRPEAYDYLAPERVADGGPPTVRSDLFSCGALWWHLLAGRPPLGTAGAIQRLHAGQKGRIPDLAYYVPNVPRVLSEAIAACLQKDPARRPESMARLASMLGSSTPVGRKGLARSLSGAERAPSLLVRSARQATATARGSAWITAGAVALVVIATLAATVWQFTRPRPGTPRPIGPPNIAASNPVSPSLPSSESAGPAATHPAPQRPAVEPGEPAGPSDVLLEPGPVAWPSARFTPGQKVRGSHAGRSRVQVPAQGLTISTDGMEIENVDFIGPDAGQGSVSPSRPALIRLQAEGLQFRACTFDGRAASGLRPAAIAWRFDRPSDASALAMPSGRVRLTNCVIQGVDAGIDCLSHASMAVELDNVLHADAGPLIRLNDCPSAEETLVLAMAQVTLRQCGPLVECRYEQVAAQPGAITIRANECVVWPAAGTGLLAFIGPDRPDRWLPAVRWSGQGSLVEPTMPLATWQGTPGRAEPLDESALAMHGVVRSEAAFAGPVQDGPAASRLTRWQVPLRSPDPPGIDPVSLPGTR